MVWGLFIAFVLIMLFLDLAVFNKKAHEIKTKEASIFTAIWVSIALLFSGVIYWLFSSGLLENATNLSPETAVLKYITGYLTELSLSIDNVFVIAVIFNSFAIPAKYQHRVLFWGILGAIIFRALMILFGVALINKFDWIIYVFGVFLLYTAYKMATSSGTEFDPKHSKVYRYIIKVFPITHKIDGEKFFIKRMGIKAATPLFIALLIIELTDILFALDSIPAILAITADPFIVFSSNILAILGLRSMYFLISRMLNKFRYIKYSLVAILGFVGIKMLISHYVEIPELLSLAVIGVALLAGILASIYLPNTRDKVPVKDLPK
jgi:tellurite resistance protein TerC